MAGVGVTGAVEEVEDLLVVELCGRKTAAGCRWVRRGPRGSLVSQASSALQVWKPGSGRLPGHPWPSLGSGSGIFPLDRAGQLGPGESYPESPSTPQGSGTQRSALVGG